jgi:hypothetical protein
LHVRAEGQSAANLNEKNQAAISELKLSAQLAMQEISNTQIEMPAKAGQV